MDSNSNYSSEMPMKWHKFLIYFSLWVGAISCAFSGFQLFTGSHYGDSSTAAQVYAYFGSLKTVDVVCGIAYILIGVYMIYTRFQLAGFRTGAPGKLTAVYLFQLVAYLGYALLASSIVKMSLSELLGAQSIGALISSIVMIIVNRIYYNKRSHLFVN